MKTYTRKDFKNHENFCLYPFTQLYCNPMYGGEGKFHVKPCCITTEEKDVYADSIESTFNHDYLKDVRRAFMSNEIPVGVCDECVLSEKASNGVSSKRLDALTSSNHVYHDVDFAVDENGTMISDFQDLDIRPSNVCNLKCVMCGPWASSKWYEDFDIFNETFMGIADVNNLKKFLTRASRQVDWDWLYAHASGLKRVFIAGGEPFFMKESRDFLQHLVDANFSSNIILEITTNATIIDDKLISLLGLFKDNCITISLDGVNDVNYIIRYPTNWDEYCYNINLLYDKFGRIVFSTVVSALNLPNTIAMLEFTSKYEKQTHKFAKCLDPDILNINSLKPNVIDHFAELLNTSVISTFYYNWLQDLVKNYAYNDKGNSEMKKYLKTLDCVRNTNSRLVLPWCWE